MLISPWFEPWFPLPGIRLIIALRSLALFFSRHQKKKRHSTISNVTPNVYDEIVYWHKIYLSALCFKIYHHFKVFFIFSTFRKTRQPFIGNSVLSVDRFEYSIQILN